MSKERKFRSKYDIIFNFCGISNSKFPLEANKNILLQKKRYEPKEEEEQEEENENDAKKSNKLNEDNNINDLKPHTKLKITFYENIGKKK